MALKDLSDYLKVNGEVAIYDGTNTTKSRRAAVSTQLKQMLYEYKYCLIWLEIICDDEDLVNTNIIRAKVNNPDFIDKEQHIAI